ncbi:MAG TPA: ATP-binding protein [Longimicrobiales bacterium]|nr:ATP-binding protein [Longimicrobiales bacterium]
MTRTRYRITWTATSLAAGAILLAGLFTYRAVVRALAEANVSGSAAAHVQSEVGVALVVLGILAVIGVGLLAQFLAVRLTALRVSVLARARGDSSAFASHLTELAAIDQAVERLAMRIVANEAAAERGGAELGTLLDAISEAILQVDGDGRIVRANPEARRLLRLDRGTIGQPVTTRLRHAELRLLLGQAIRGEVVDSREITLDDRRLLVSARPLPAPHGTRPGAVVAFVDLTQIRRLESVRRDFVANVSHELKTPLTSIRGYAETLLNDDLPPELQRQFLEVVHRNADRLHHIVEDLLDLSRLESGGWRPELQRVDAVALVQDVWSGCADRAAARRISFGAPAGATFVRADPGGLRQILVNLLENALRYTPDDGRIEVRMLPPPDNGRPTGDPASAGVTGHADDLVLIEVRDNGAGIPSDALPRIFERFYRVDPARSRAEGGTGLGLSIVRHLAESMGGDVAAESDLGRGTTIRVRLPAAGPADS